MFVARVQLRILERVQGDSEGFQVPPKGMKEFAYQSSMNYPKILKKVSVIANEVVPIELSPFNQWIQCIVDYLNQETKAEKITTDLDKQMRELAGCYLEVQEIKDAIDNSETKISKYLSCIEKADNNIKLLKCFRGDEELDQVIQSCNKNYMFFKREINALDIPGVNDERMSVNPLVESFLGTFNISIDAEVSQSAESSDRTPLIQMEEKSLEAYDHFPDIKVEEKAKKQKSKRRCCGFA